MGDPEIPIEPDLEDPTVIADTPATGASPNTPAVRAEYMAPDPPDVYQNAVPVQTRRK